MIELQLISSKTTIEKGVPFACAPCSYVREREGGGGEITCSITTKM